MRLKYTEPAYIYIIVPIFVWVVSTFTLREEYREYRLGVYENRVPRSIFVPKRDEMTGGWR
jgi:hypothetical protein